MLVTYDRVFSLRVEAAVESFLENIVYRTLLDASDGLDIWDRDAVGLQGQYLGPSSSVVITHNVEGIGRCVGVGTKVVGGSEGIRNIRH